MRLKKLARKLGRIFNPVVMIIIFSCGTTWCFINLLAGFDFGLLFGIIGGGFGVWGGARNLYFAWKASEVEYTRSA